MAAIVNDLDVKLQAATPRTVSTNLPSTVNVPGNVTGSLNGIPVQDVIDAANTGGGTENFFTTSASDPTGGAAGDAHFNSTTNVMWFNIGGVWTRGGTVNASQITTGTLAAARIAANTITAGMLNVSTLSAITANLGSVTAGNITGLANIDITGIAKFSGQSGTIGDYYTGIFNDGLSTKGGLKAYAGIIGVAVYGDAGTTGDRGVAGVARSSSGTGVQAVNTSTGVALAVQGRMTKTGTELVTNLNAQLFNSKAATAYCQTVLGNTGTCTVSGNGFNLISTVSGTQVRGNGSNGLILEAISDERIKANITDEVLGIDFINSLRPVTYELQERMGLKYHGFIAQDVAVMFDENENDALSQVNPDGLMGVDYVSLIAPLVKAVQQLSAEIEILKGQNNV